MKTVYTNGKRFESYRLYENQLHRRYDYANEGLLKHLVSPRLRDTRNPILKYMLSYVERSLIFTMKSVDILQNFHNYNWKNR